MSRAEQAIEDATGQHPNGFRGPGFSVSEEVLLALERRGYRYDASTLPTFIGPLARAFYFRNADLTPEERAERDALFGPFRDGTRPLKPYRWRLDGNGLIEVPVTTMPLLRTPIHMSYLMYLAERSSPALAHRYLAVALRLCRWMGVAPSLLLHSHDFVGADDVPAMSFFPGFRLPGEAKLRLVGRCVDLLRRDFDVVPLASYVDGLAALPSRRASILPQDAAQPASATSPPAAEETHEEHPLLSRADRRPRQIAGRPRAGRREDRPTTGPSCRSWSRRTTRPRSSPPTSRRSATTSTGSRRCTAGR